VRAIASGRCGSLQRLLRLAADGRRPAATASPCRRHGTGVPHLSRIEVESGRPGRQLHVMRSWHSSCFALLEEINDMFENIFGIHEQALLLHGQRIGVLATNMANADTPNFKARDIDFSEVLAGTDDSARLAMSTTQASHIAMNDTESVGGELKYRNPYQASLDGNTVEMPVEQAAFSENNVRYQASLTFINSRIADLQFAIAGQ
jgi:flagellar basal-body rod protein FlgB